MSKFLNNSVQYCETEVFKIKHLSKILKLYNEYILISSNNSIDNKSKYIIPNNSNKYYMLITNKSEDLSKYKVLYFFPDQYNHVTNLNKNLLSDFYVEIDSNKVSFDKNSYLFEGYFYNNNTNFLISDILAIDESIISCDYSLRYSLVNKIILNQVDKLYNLNGSLSINIHSIFTLCKENEKLLFNIFKNNFIFKSEINCIEYIDEKSLKKTRCINNIISEELIELKKIYKEKYIDVYKVCNIITNNNEGILFLKTINTSKKMRTLFNCNSNEYIEISCKFNLHFNKWYPYFA